MTTIPDRPLSRVSRYLEMRKAKPLRGLDDSVHRVHAGTEWEADLSLGDLEHVVSMMLSHPSEREVEIAARALADADCAALLHRGVMTQPKDWRIFEKEARDALDAFLRDRFGAHYPENPAQDA